MKRNNTLQTKILFGAIRAALTVFVFWTVLGCGIFETRYAKLPTNQSTTNTEMNIKMEGTGALFVKYSIKPIKTTCTKTTQNASVAIRKSDSMKFESLKSTCDLKSKSLVFFSDSKVKKGTYVLKIETKVDGIFKSSPVVSVKYRNANLKGGSSQFAEGAQPVEANQAIKGLVDYSGGKATQWYQLKGSNTMVALSMIVEEDAENVSVKVYRNGVTQKSPSFLTGLSHGSKRNLPLTQDDLYLKVQGKASTGATPFTIYRRDFTNSRKVAVNVLDCYPVDQTSSLALIQKVSGLSVNDEVSLMATSAIGANVDLGSCMVTAVNQTEATCRLTRSLPQGLRNYSGQAHIKKGGA